MEIVTTDTPAKLAGKHINNSIEQHDGDVVCLLAGGSALNVIPHIKASKHSRAGRVPDAKINKFECRTIFIMGDERGSRDATINNSLQLMEKYPDSYVAQNLIFTVPEASENLENFSTRISENFSAEISKLRNLKILQVLGVGLDGHTAGIFPMDSPTFNRTYTADTFMVPVYLESLRIDSRASCPPDFIASEVSELITYVVGPDKKMVLESLVNESKEIHERPAELIKRHERSTVYTNILVEPK